MKFVVGVLIALVASQVSALDFGFGVGFGRSTGGDEIAVNNNTKLKSGSGAYFYPKFRIELNHRNYLNIGLSRRNDYEEMSNGVDTDFETNWLEGTYEKAFGFVVGGAVRIGHVFRVGVRYEDISYKAKNAYLGGTRNVDGESYGLFCDWVFGDSVHRLNKLRIEG